MCETMQILVVEDDVDLGRQIEHTLEKEGYDVTWVQDGAAAMRIDPTVFKLAILDLMLPGAHGFDVLKAIRSRVDVPILVLSALRESSEIVRALELGADDYATKPFWPEQLLARLRARMWRPVLQVERGVRVGALFLDAAAHAVRVDGQLIPLTHNEFRLATILVRRPGVTMMRSRLFEDVFETDDYEGTISEMRAQLALV